MAVKFKMCKRCSRKPDPLERNWINPGQEFCPHCEKDMLLDFLASLGYTMEDVHKRYEEGLDGTGTASTN